ncbi:type VI secretion system baseplate subunit TssG [Ectothiorhodospira lacustris]|uniref:type VI secretion system baseplate subunit TssG n=1 Tax=Ectothiorhodospira lacustris TaxID=2899127 RepID=UPI001EE8CBE9|nr:type VI secretion system baseplate subunit TssG [Ectothiorhodospira lacustris]MCG5509247.1 type VI secretion system baseplate subunit TssG [Ectothiorhodospira lacustris]MCG5521037.1 type VI secretion system baseplate subunit TssG [Ectothiorhodospira lacustris]
MSAERPPSAITSADLDFPATPVRRAQREGAVHRIETVFPGLRGPLSPLPLEDLEGLCRQDPDAEALRAFLDLFDRRFHQLLLATWRTPRAYLFTCMEAPPPLLRYLDALKPSGMPTAPGLKARIMRMLDHLGMTGLEVTLHTFRYCRRPLPETTRLGSLDGTCLGRDAALGEEVRVPEGLRILIGPLTPGQAVALYAGRVGLTREIRAYLGPFTPFQPVMQMTPEQPRGLGNGDLYLGLSTPLGECRGSHEARLIPLPQQPISGIERGDRHPC